MSSSQKVEMPPRKRPMARGAGNTGDQRIILFVFLMVVLAIIIFGFIVELSESRSGHGHAGSIDVNGTYEKTIDIKSSFLGDVDVELEIDANGPIDVYLFDYSSDWSIDNENDQRFPELREYKMGRNFSALRSWENVTQSNDSWKMSLNDEQEYLVIYENADNPHEQDAAYNPVSVYFKSHFNITGKSNWRDCSSWIIFPFGITTLAIYRRRNGFN